MPRGEGRHALDTGTYQPSTSVVVGGQRAAESASTSNSLLDEDFVFNTSILD